jgi:hypothetical protein
VRIEDRGLPLRNSPRVLRIALAALISLSIWLSVCLSVPLARASGERELDAAEKQKVSRLFAAAMAKKKGPYSLNYCVCQDGQKKPVMAPDGSITSPCGATARFCAAYRVQAADDLAAERMYIANIFSRDLHLWDQFPNHHDLVRGYVLEKFFVETNPTHKLAEMRAYGGLSGAEYEARDAPLFFERYLADPSFEASRHYLLAYELQRRFFIRNEQGDIQKIRNLASSIYRSDPKFKPLRDATHNQLSAALLPRLRAYRAKMPNNANRSALDDLIKEIEKLTTLDESALVSQIAAIQDAKFRERLKELLPPKGAEPIVGMQRLADVMVFVRDTVDAKKVSVPDRRRGIDIAVTAATVLQRRGSDYLAKGEHRVRDYVEMLGVLADAAYGAGLLGKREVEAARQNVADLLSEDDVSRADLRRDLVRARRVAEWAQGTTLLAFEEVLPVWTFLLPQTRAIGDDVLRGSPLLLYAQVLERLDQAATGAKPVRHEIFGEEVQSDVRALNPGLAIGVLRVAPKKDGYSRDELVALPETPADLEPAAGILTQGEGNVLSHVQLLARALGIPNVVVGPAVYQKLKKHDGQRVYLIATPRGRVLMGDAADMPAEVKSAVTEYARNETRDDDGKLGRATKKLHIDKEKIDVEHRTPLDLKEVRRKDSGVRVGPKAAFLGELKFLFPDNVARGVVVPFGAYYDHFRRAPVAVPEHLAGAGIAKPGEPLHEFVEETYATFFDELIPAKKPERELTKWIQPRLEIMQYSIRSAPLAPELKSSIRDQLAANGLLDPNRPESTVGCFVRSDTNVEDLEDFNGAGLNLTLFNLRSLDDIYEGLKEVWASPFSYRSFSWRQTLIDEPLWVLPSVVILESVPSEKSGVLVTADIDHGDEEKMLIATSEGVGGAVDGTSAETVLWSPEGTELVTMFKSPYRRLLGPDGGSELVPSTGKAYVLDEKEIAELTAAGGAVRDKLEPARDASGRPRPWDIEFGFSKGKLWLFQSRPFLGNDELQNLPALAALDGDTGGDEGSVSLGEKL